MKAYSYIDKGYFGFVDKPRPKLINDDDAIVRITMSSICASDLHIKNGSVARAVKGITVGHEMVGIVEETGPSVKSLHTGQRVAVNVETFCGECYFCRRGFINNCEDPDGGWALGCRIDGGQTEFVRIPHANTGLTPIPDGVSDEQALFTGDILSTGFWAAKISQIIPDDVVLIIGAGPTGLCSLICTMLHNPHRIVVCESDSRRREFVRSLYPEVSVVSPERCLEFIRSITNNRGADTVIEVAGSDESFKLAWQAARPNAIVTIVALYDRPQILPLPDMYGKNLTFKTGGVDACDCAEILKLISEGYIDTTPFITHRYPLSRIAEAYNLFERRLDGVVKIAITPDSC